jgi:DNA processing protein
MWEKILFLFHHEVKTLSLESFNQALLYLEQSDQPQDLHRFISPEHPMHKFVFANRNWFCALKERVAGLESRGWRFAIYGTTNYPSALYLMASPPLGFFFIGETLWLSSALIGVVGSRKPNLLSLRWMDESFSQFVENTNWVVTSGGAYGIDQKAHSVAIRKKKPTLCFLPSGLANPYPTLLRSWSENILKYGGCMVSQFAPESEVKRHHFIKRNEVIAQLSEIVLIVQAGRRSGTYMTAQHALRLHKTIAVVPHHPLENEVMGSLDLINDGGFPVRDHRDLLVLAGALNRPNADYNKNKIGQPNGKPGCQ